MGRDEGELGTLRSVIDGLWAHGESPALVAVGEEGVEIWTYGELAGRVLGLGRGLRVAGVERGDHVALLAANRREWIAACLAVISAGAVVVPLDANSGMRPSVTFSRTAAPGTSSPRLRMPDVWRT